MAVKIKPLRVTAVAVTAQMIAPLVTMIALASARDVIAVVVVTVALVEIAAVEKKNVVAVKIVAMVAAKAVARVAAMVARHLPVMAVLPKLA